MREANNKRIRRHFLGAGLLVGFVFGGLITWSVLAPFEGAVITSGTITVETQNKAIQHLEGGIVEAIRVREGDLVEAGDTLLVLDTTAVESALASLDTKLIDLLAEEARLVSERDGTNILTLRPESATMFPDSALNTELQAQSEFRDARQRSYQTQLSVLGSQSEQLVRQRNGIESDIQSKRVQLDILFEELAAQEFMLNQQLAPKAQVLALRRERTSLQGAIESLTAEIARIEVQIGETQLERINLQEAFREEVLARLSVVRTEANDLLQQRVALIDRLTRSEIQAPRMGRVVGVKTHTLGGVIAPGDPIMQIVPKEDALVANVRILTQDIDKVFPGQEVTIRFSAFNQNTTPEVTGQILNVSADAMEDANTGQPYYNGVVSLPDKSALPEHVELYPGMPVDAMLKTESRTVLSYLIKPAQDAMAKTFKE